MKVNNIKNITRGFFGWALIGCLLVSVVGHAALAASDAPPVRVLRQASQSVLQELVRNKAAARRDPRVLYSLVKRILLPHFAVEVMALSVVGRAHWLRATPQQRQRFVQEFVKLVTKTYSTALSSYQNQQIRFLPMRGGTQGRRRVEVHSRIVHPGGGPAIPVDYRLIRSKGRWLVYDFSVDEVSLVRSYRSQFSSVLNQGGLPALLQRLIKHNKAP